MEYDTAHGGFPPPHLLLRTLLLTELFVASFLGGGAPQTRPLTPPSPPTVPPMGLSVLDDDASLTTLLELLRRLCPLPRTIAGAAWAYAGGRWRLRSGLSALFSGDLVGEPGSCRTYIQPLLQIGRGLAVLYPYHSECSIAVDADRERVELTQSSRSSRSWIRMGKAPPFWQTAICHTPFDNEWGWGKTKGVRLRILELLFSLITPSSF